MPAPASIGTDVSFEGDHFVWQESDSEWISEGAVDPFDFKSGREMALTIIDPPQSDEFGAMQDENGVSAVDVYTYDADGNTTDHKLYQIVFFNDIRQWVRSDETANYAEDPQYVYGVDFHPYTLLSPGDPGFRPLGDGAMDDPSSEDNMTGSKGFKKNKGFRHGNGFTEKNGFTKRNGF